MPSKKILEYIAKADERRYKRRHKKKGKRKKTPEQLKAIRQKNMAKAMDIARKRSIATRKKKAEERRKEKEREKKRLQRLKEKEKKKAIEKKIRETRKKRVKHGKEIYKTVLEPYKIKNKKHFYIYLSRNGEINKKTGFVGKYASIEELNEIMKFLEKKNDMIFFPQRHIMESKKPTPVKYEYVVFRRKYENEEEDVKNAYLKNEFGRFVEHKSENMPDDYFVFDKMPANIEESVWVYGYEKLHDRKTFKWIYENLLFDGFNDGYDMKRIYLFRNKIVLCNDNEDIDLIILKCVNDAVNFYNTLLKYLNDARFIFMGNIVSGSKLKPWIEDKIAEKTGWNKNKISRNSSGL